MKRRQTEIMKKEEIKEPTQKMKLEEGETKQGYMCAVWIVERMRNQPTNRRTEPLIDVRWRMKKYKAKDLGMLFE